MVGINRRLQMIATFSMIVGASLVVPSAAWAGTSGEAESSRPSTESAAPVTAPEVIGGEAARLCDTPKEPGRMACLAFAQSETAAAENEESVADESPAGFTPADLRDAYRLPSLTAGFGQTVAVVVAFDNPNAEADLAVYRSRFGLPPCTSANGCFRKVNQFGVSGPLPKPEPRWAAEASLDLQMVSATCPNCRLILVEASSDYAKDLFVGIAAAVALGAKIVSNSYGSPEYPDQVEDGAMLNHPGVALTVASGDGGYGLNFPASSTYVTAVGGTTLSRASNSRGWAESVWTGAGSGCSTYERKPAHQVDTGCSTRTVADIAAVADPQTGVAIYDTYQGEGWRVFGGTSAAAPIIAGAYALAGGPAAGTLASTYPYRSPSALFDVADGANGACDNAYLCTGMPGYDGPTGIGTPNGVDSLRVPGTTGKITGLVTDVTSGKPVAAARVSVGNAMTFSDSDGRYTLELPVGTHEITATARGFKISSVPGIAVVATVGATTVDMALTPAPVVKVEGTIFDASGHGWSLYARVSVVGPPGTAMYTDPLTGRYVLELTGGSSYSLLVRPGLPGYESRQITIDLGESDQNVDIGLAVNARTCEAPGYRRATEDASCLAVEGSLLIGHVRDAITGKAVNGATVRSHERPDETGFSLPTPDDERIDDGFYWLFSTLVGDHSFQASKAGFLPRPRVVTVLPEDTVGAELKLDTGRVAVTPDKHGVAVPLGSTATIRFTVTNTGSAPATVDVRERGAAQAAPSGSSSVPWLSVDRASFTVPPGETVTITATLTATDGLGGQPGDHEAWLAFATDTPYPEESAAVVMKVTPPAGWVRVTGGVEGATCGGRAEPLSGATIDVWSVWGARTTLTGPDGRYELWVPGAGSHVTVTVRKDGWRQQRRYARLTPGATVGRWRLRAERPC